ncbi:hypothetical protein IWW46_002023, partial [Coemansia sp. RSA 2440]
ESSVEEYTTSEEAPAYSAAPIPSDYETSSAEESSVEEYTTSEEAPAYSAQPAYSAIPVQ